KDQIHSCRADVQPPKNIISEEKSVQIESVPRPSPGEKYGNITQFTVCGSFVGALFCPFRFAQCSFDELSCFVAVSFRNRWDIYSNLAVAIQWLADTTAMISHG